MKTDLIYRSGRIFDSYYRDTEATIAKSGKTVNLGTMDSRIDTNIWGGWSKELALEADSINRAQSELNTRRHALDDALKATQPALIAAAKAAPKDPKPEPFRFDGELEV